MTAAAVTAATQARQTAGPGSESGPTAEGGQWRSLVRPPRLRNMPRGLTEPKTSDGGEDWSDDDLVSTGEPATKLYPLARLMTTLESVTRYGARCRRGRVCVVIDISDSF